MKLAMIEASKAYRKDEVPVGAVIVERRTGKIIAKTHNLVQKRKSTLAHAEILAIEKACKKLKKKYLFDCDLYVTLEPCTMCTGAISNAKIGHLYFGAEDQKTGAVINGIKFFNKKTCTHKPLITHGLMENESSKLLKDFFRTKRKSGV